MLDINMLAEELRWDVAYQQTPDVLDESDYIHLIEFGIRNLFVDTGRASEYTTDRYVYDGATEKYDYNFNAAEIEYILLMAKISFFKRVQTNVNQMVSYVTDALSVSNGDKPYANLKDTIGNLEQERRIKFYKLLPDVISDNFPEISWGKR